MAETTLNPVASHENAIMDEEKFDGKADISSVYADSLDDDELQLKKAEELEV